MTYRILIFLFVALFSLQGIAFAHGSPAQARASGDGFIIIGSDPYNFDNNIPIKGAISINVTDHGDRQSPLQNIDNIMVETKFSTGDDDYDIRMSEPMLGNRKQPTWFGVGYDKKMHGKTNTGTRKLPLMEPDIAIWGWAEISKNGQLIHGKVPAHIKVKQEDPLKGITLMVGSVEQPLTELPDGYLHVRWPSLDHLALPDKQNKIKYWSGSVALVLLNLFFGWLAFGEQEER